MGDGLALVGLLGAADTAVLRFVDVFFGVYILLLLAYVLLSWIRLPYSPTLERVQRFLFDVCDPYLRLFRRVIPPLGPLDLSPMIGIIVLYVIQQLIGRLVVSVL